MTILTRCVKSVVNAMSSEIFGDTTKIKCHHNWTGPVTASAKIEDTHWFFVIKACDSCGRIKIIQRSVAQGKSSSFTQNRP